MIRTVIFDIGDVLINVDWSRFCLEKGYDELMTRKLAKATKESVYWDEYDRGVWSDEKIVEHFITLAPELEEDIRFLCKNLRGLCRRQEYAIPWIKEVQEKGYQVLVLSNFSERALIDCAEAMDFLKYVDGGILSFREKLIKPDPQIYRLLMEKYQIRKGEAVFLDDRKENIIAAEKEGIYGIQVMNHEQAYRDLNRFLDESK